MNRIVRDAFKDRSFMVCGVVLLMAAVGIQGLVQTLQIHLRKAPVPLVKPLDEMDTAKLWPYKLVQSVKLKEEIEEELGTKDYLQMIFEDTSLYESKAPGKFINFFVTYYTGGTDQVPHVPDVCYVGGGNDLLTSVNTSLAMPGLGLAGDELPVRELVFQNPNSMTPTARPVIYFFAVNGKFENKRDGVRVSLASPTLKYAYFSKVEVAFLGEPQPKPEEALEIAKKFFAKSLPVLMKDHWQDWDRFLEEESRKADEK
jgi:hypothetical protein